MEKGNAFLESIQTSLEVCSRLTKLNTLRTSLDLVDSIYDLLQSHEVLFLENRKGSYELSFDMRESSKNIINLAVDDFLDDLREYASVIIPNNIPPVFGEDVAKEREILKEIRKNISRELFGSIEEGTCSETKLEENIRYPDYNENGLDSLRLQRSCSEKMDFFPFDISARMTDDPTSSKKFWNDNFQSFKRSNSGEPSKIRRMTNKKKFRSTRCFNLKQC